MIVQNSRTVCIFFFVSKDAQCSEIFLQFLVSGMWLILCMMEPLVGIVGGKAPHESAGLGRLNIIFFHLDSSKFPIHYECWVQNRLCLKNRKKSKNSKICFRTLRIFCDYIFLRMYRHSWATIYQKLEIKKLIVHSIQDIAQFFGQNWNYPFWGGEGLHVVN